MPIVPDGSSMPTIPDGCMGSGSSMPTIPDGLHGVMPTIPSELQLVVACQQLRPQPPNLHPGILVPVNQGVQATNLQGSRAGQGAGMTKGVQGRHD